MEEVRTRLFLAVPLPEYIKTVLIESLPAGKIPGLKRTPQDNLHLTLYFIGDVPETETERIIKQTEAIVQTSETFSLEFNKIILKKQGKVPAMIWGLFNTHSVFEQVSAALAGKLQGKGHKQTLPHVTLARIKKPSVVDTEHMSQQFKSPEPFALPVTHIQLWESMLRPEGPAYYTRYTFVLPDRT